MTICKYRQPLLSTNDAARIYFHKTDLIENNKYFLSRLNNGKYVYTTEDMIGKKSVIIDDRKCIFYDEENDKCILEKFKPSECSDSKDSLHVLNITEVSPEPRWDRKIMKIYTKRMKEYMLLYLVLWNLNKHIDKNDEVTELEDIFTVTYSYKFILRKTKKLSATQHVRLKALKPEYEVVATLYNRLYRVFMMIPHEFLDIMVDKLNKLITGGNFKSCNIDISEITRASVYMVHLYRLYVNNYNNKSKNFTDVVNILDTHKFLKYINNSLGGKDQPFIYEKLDCIVGNNNQMFNIITKQK